MNTANLNMVVEDHIATVTWCRPPINAVDMDGNIAITKTFEEINQNDDIWAVILRAEGKVHPLAWSPLLIAAGCVIYQYVCSGIAMWGGGV